MPGSRGYGDKDKHGKTECKAEYVTKTFVETKVVPVTTVIYSTIAETKSNVKTTEKEVPLRWVQHLNWMSDQSNLAAQRRCYLLQD